MKGSIEILDIQGSKEEWYSLTTSSIIKRVHHLHYQVGRYGEKESEAVGKQNGVKKGIGI